MNIPFTLGPNEVLVGPARITRRIVGKMGAVLTKDEDVFVVENGPTCTANIGKRFIVRPRSPHARWQLETTDYALLP